MNKNHGNKILKVVNHPCNTGYVPSIKVSGKWLNTFGFEVGEQVQIRSQKGFITISKVNNVPSDDMRNSDYTI